MTPPFQSSIYKDGFERAKPSSGAARAASDRESRLGTVFAVAKAVARLTLRG